MVRITQPDNSLSPVRRRVNDRDIPYTVPFVVLRDHRERSGGWRFEGLHAGSDKDYRPLTVQTRELYLPTGDYTAETLFGEQVPVIIERKSADDMLGSIIGGHTNLRKEHERMHALVEQAGYFCCLICEAALSDLITEMESPRWGRRASGELLLGCAASWPARYGVPWYFCGTRSVAERLALKIVWKAHSRIAAENANCQNLEKKRTMQTESI